MHLVSNGLIRANFMHASYFIIRKRQLLKLAEKRQKYQGRKGTKMIGLTFYPSDLKGLTHK